MMGPNSSGRSDARIMTAQPAWQLPITQGLPSACGCAADDFLDEQGFGARDALDRLSGHRFRQETDEIAGMTCFHRDADLAVRLEPADARAMTGARIDHDERAPVHINFNALRWNDAHQHIIDRFIQLAPVDDQFGGILQDVRCRLSDIFPVLIAAPAQDVHEQDVALSASIMYSTAEATPDMGRPAGLLYPSTCLTSLSDFI